MSSLLIFCCLINLYSYQNFKRRQNARLEICIAQSKDNPINFFAEFTINNEVYQYNTEVYESVECKLNDNGNKNLKNHVRCKPLYVAIFRQCQE